MRATDGVSRLSPSFLSTQSCLFESIFLQLHPSRRRLMARRRSKKNPASPLDDNGLKPKGMICDTKCELLFLTTSSVEIIFLHSSEKLSEKGYFPYSLTADRKLPFTNKINSISRNYDLIVYRTNLPAIFLYLIVSATFQPQR